MIFPRSWSRIREWEHLCPGSVLDADQAIVWGASARITLCRGGSGQLRREPLAASPGNREPRTGRDQGKGLRLGYWEVFSINCVC